MEKIDICPVCENMNFSEFLKARDHFFTREEFTIVECSACGFRFTNPRPDENEIVRYYDSPEYIAHDSQKNDLLQSVYRIVRNISLRNKFSIVRKYSPGNSILDIGCGTGEFLRYCNKMEFHTTGIEPNEKARSFGINQYGLNIFDEPELGNMKPGSFDVITMWHVLEHVHRLNERIRLIKSLLKPGGVWVIAVPDSNSWDARHYHGSWAAYDLPRHLYHFNNETLSKLVSKNGFDLEKIVPLKFDAFYISLLSEKYKNGKQNYFRAVLNGLRSNMDGRRNGNNYSSMIYICKIAGETK